MVTKIFRSLFTVHTSPPLLPGEWLAGWHARQQVLAVQCKTETEIKVIMDFWAHPLVRCPPNEL